MGETEHNSGNSHMELQATLQETNELTDDELVTAVVAGDEAAFEMLFKRHRLQVGRVAGRFFRRREQVEEIVQDSFTKAYFALKDYTGGRDKSFIAWLMRITVNTCYDELRRANRLPKTTTHSDLSADEATWIEARMRAVDAASDVESATVTRDLANKLLSRLAPDDRLVLTLLNAEELSVAEIAETTGWSIAKVKVRAHRARAALRKVLGKLL